MVELVGGECLSGAEQQAVGAGGQLRVPEPHQPPDRETAARQDARHGPDGAVGVFERLPQIEEAAALGHGGQTELHGLPHRSPHRAVLAQRPCVQFRVAARQIQPAKLRRKGRIVQGAEWDKLGPGGGQGLQRFCVGKAKASSCATAIRVRAGARAAG